MIRRFACAIIVAASTVVAVGVAAPAHASNAGSLVAQINAARAAAGRPAFVHRADLAAIALRHAQKMASLNSLHHNRNLVTQVSNWQAVGENVGMGGNARSMHQAFMNSPKHRANILDKDFSEVGLGVTIDARGVMWVTEVFRRPMRSLSRRTGLASPRAGTKATTRPKAAPRPALSKLSTASGSAIRPAAVRWAVPSASKGHLDRRSNWLSVRAAALTP